MFLRESLHTPWDCRSARGSVYSRHTGMRSPKSSSISGMVLWHIPDSTVRQNDASSQTFSSLTGFRLIQSYEDFSRHRLRDDGCVLGAHTKEFTFCEFTLISASLFTEFSFANFFKVRSFSCGLGPNSSHPFETAP